MGVSKKEDKERKRFNRLFSDVESDSVSTSDGEKGYMEIIKHIYDMGHEVASHTYEHKVLSDLSEEEIEYQMNKQSDIIFEAIGKR